MRASSDHILTSHEQDQKMQIDPTDLAAALKNDPDAKLVDVRTREEYDAVKVMAAFWTLSPVHQKTLAQPESSNQLV